MEERYSRNRIYVSNDEMVKIKNTKILLGGAGIGSIIAECALRFGFESITVVDGDHVELSNLNRQNYMMEDMGTNKAKALVKRLSAINPQATLRAIDTFIDKNNVNQIASGYDIAINALDFKDESPFLFDDICSEQGIPVLHPYNFGWAGFVTVVTPQGSKLRTISSEPCGFEIKMAEHVCRQETLRDVKLDWLCDILKRYKEKGTLLPPPQLAIASWITAGICVNIMYLIATRKAYKAFPEFYLSAADLCT